MLIIPVERQIDWRRPPWATLALILINILVFVGYQSRDWDIYTDAVDYYLEAELDGLEAPAYRHYLQRQINLEGRDLHDQLLMFNEAVDSDNRELLAWMMMADLAFVAYLEENRARLLAQDEVASWILARQTLHDQFLDHLSSRRYGLVPAHLSVADTLTYQFLHGGWGHLIGNMLFLFLLGFTVERALGPARYLTAYLACGALAGLVHAAMNWGSPVPLVGASGSVSGLMGMYVAIFGLQKIRFFYFVVVYFNYFRAPALLVLPLWVGKEIYDHVTAHGSNVAYLAHAGGLAAGAGLVWLFGKSWLQVREEFFEPEEDEQEAQFRREYARALSELGLMNFEAARLQLEALARRYPERIVLHEHLHHLSKLRPDKPEYRERTRSLMDLALKQRNLERMLEVWRDYLKTADERFPLEATDHSKVLFACLREGALKDAEKAFDKLRQTGEPEMVEEACRLLIAEFEKRQMAPKARHYRQWLPA